VQELQPREAGEVGIEGDEAAAAGDGEGGKVGIRPQPVRKIGPSGEGGEVVVNRRGFLEETMVGIGQKLSIEFPGFRVGEGAAKDTWLSAEAEESHHGNAGEADLGIGNVLPIIHSGGVVEMILIHQGEPDIDIRYVHLLGF
jgi:hypothetical protein